MAGGETSQALETGPDCRGIVGRGGEEGGVDGRSSPRDSRGVRATRKKEKKKTCQQAGSEQEVYCMEKAACGVRDDGMMTEEGKTLLAAETRD